jgi:hypothetical protein
MFVYRVSFLTTIIEPFPCSVDATPILEKKSSMKQSAKPSSGTIMVFDVYRSALNLKLTDDVERYAMVSAGITAVVRQLRMENSVVRKKG